MGVEATLFVQDLGLHVLHRRGDETCFLANGRDLRVHALAKVADHLDELVEHGFHGGLGGRRLIGVVGNGGGAMGLAARRGEGGCGQAIVDGTCGGKT